MHPVTATISNCAPLSSLAALCVEFQGSVFTTRLSRAAQTLSVLHIELLDNISCGGKKKKEFPSLKKKSESHWTKKKKKLKFGVIIWWQTKEVYFNVKSDTSYDFRWPFFFFWGSVYLSVKWEVQQHEGLVPFQFHFRRSMRGGSSVCVLSFGGRGKESGREQV